MKKAYIDGKVCIGPNFSRAEFSLIKRNLAEQMGLKTLAESLGAAGNLQRLRILYLLHAHKEMCVCDLAEALQLAVSPTSQHLKKLKDRNIVKTRRHGHTIYYSLFQNVFASKLEEMLTMEETREHHAFVMTERS